jgi:hypothetical protein
MTNLYRSALNKIRGQHAADPLFHLFRNPGIFVLSMGLIFAGTASAVIIPCPGTPTALGTIGSPSSSSNGCTSGNLQFANFSIGAATGSINGVTLINTTSNEIQPNGANIFLSATDGGFGWTSTANASTCRSNANDDGFCVQGANRALVSSITYNVTTTNGNQVDGILAAATLISHSSGGGGATAILFREYCPGGSAFSQNCAGYGVLQIGAVNGNFNTISGSATAVFSPAANVWVRDTVFLTTNNGAGSFAYLQSADFGLLTPEPSTLVLLGSALTILGAIRWRGRRVHRRRHGPASWK